MKGMIEYDDENETKYLLRDYDLQYVRTLRFLNQIVFNYKDGEELNAVAMAMKTGRLSKLTLEDKIIEVKK